MFKVEGLGFRQGLVLLDYLVGTYKGTPTWDRSP